MLDPDHDPGAGQLGDMPPEELREHGHAVIEWIARYLTEVENYPVLATVRPGEVASRLPASAPEEGEAMESILGDLDQLLIPGTTHWNHPGFFGYFAITGSGPGILAEAISAALNLNAMIWRTGPAATELEERTLDWLRQLMGLPAEFRGTIQDTASVSTLTALLAARHKALPGLREVGMAARPVRPLRIYCSEEAHSATERAAIIMGIGLQGVRKIATNDRLEMDTGALERAVEEDLMAKVRPLAVVATVGTTATTAVDPIGQISRLCARRQLWLHLDAAYGGAAALLPEMRWILAGSERADSLVVNPHKWLFTPVDCSALFFREPEAARGALSLVPAILRTPEREVATDLMDYGPALGRRFRALKLWMVLRYFGAEGVRRRLRKQIELAREFEAWVRDEPGWEVVIPGQFSVAVFRYRPAGARGETVNLLNRKIADSVNGSGEAFISHTPVKGETSLRVAVGNLKTERRHLERAWELLREAARG